MLPLRLLLILGVSLIALPLSAQSSVGSRAQTVSTFPDNYVYISLDLVTTRTVAGINGQLNYNSSLLSEPVISAGSTPWFILLGNVVTPGQFRFVVYANPTSTLFNYAPAMYVRFKTSSGFTSGVSTTLTYTLEAASDPSGNSLPQVDFSDAIVKTVVIRNSADSWLIYE